MLDVLRSILLISADSIVNFTVYWKPEDEGTYRKWKSLLASKNLRRVRVFDPRVLLGEKISDTVRTFKITLPGDLHAEVVWSLFEKTLFVPARLEKVEIEAIARGHFDVAMSLVTGGAEFFALFSTVPALYFNCTHPRPEFWNAFETLDNILELSIKYHGWSDEYRVPLDQFVNLRKVRMRVIGDLLDLDVVVPQLRTMELTDIKQTGLKQDVLEHLARAAPNLVNLTIDAESDVSTLVVFWIQRDLFTVTIPEHFTYLQKLNIAVPLDILDVAVMVERFEALRPGGLKEVKVKGLVFYTRSECVVKSEKIARWVKTKRCENNNAAFEVFLQQGLFSSDDRLDISDKLRSEGRPSYLFQFSQV